MKKIVFCAALIAFIGCNSVVNIHAPGAEKWKLKTRAANRMIKRDDPTIPLSIKDSNIAARNELSNNYKLTEVHARYIKINRRDYGKLRNLSGDTTKVRGYETLIYEAVSKAGSLLPTKVYYDIITICPPPHPCK